MFPGDRSIHARLGWLETQTALLKCNVLRLNASVVYDFHRSGDRFHHGDRDVMCRAYAWDMGVDCCLFKT